MTIFTKNVHIQTLHSLVRYTKSCTKVHCHKWAFVKSIFLVLMMHRFSRGVFFLAGNGNAIQKNPVQERMGRDQFTAIHKRELNDIFLGGKGKRKDKKSPNATLFRDEVMCVRSTASLPYGCFRV